MEKETISITEIRRATADEWRSIWLRCGYSTYFHSREWAEIWTAYSGGRINPEPKIVIFSDGKRALLPLSCTTSRKELIKTYMLSPGDTFGGWLSADDLSIDHARQLTSYLVTKLGSITWNVNPYDQLALSTMAADAKYDETHALCLARGFDAIHADFSKGHRSAAKKARTAGVIIRVGESTDNWHTYYGVYQDSLRRWGDSATSNYRWEIFEEMSRRSSGQIKLWLAEHEGQVIAGCICLYSPKHVVYWHGAALESAFNLRPTTLLLREIIRDCCNRGANWFDFNPSGGHEGVKAFKSHFGATPLPCPVVDIETSSARLVEAAAQLLDKLRR